MKKAVRIFLIILVLLTVISCTACSKGEPKTFSDDGISITLTDEFEKKSIDGHHTLYYESKDAVVIVTKEPFSMFADGQISQYSPLSDYTRLVLSNNQLTAEIVTKEGYEYFTYEREVETEAFFISKTRRFTYLAVTYKSDSAFWLVQFACESDDFSSKQATFFAYADSVVFY